MKKLTWNTEAGRQMWLEGKKDSEIADEFGVATATVAAYRKRHWEKLLPQQTLNAIRKNAKEACGESQLAAGAVVKINEMLQGESASVAPMGATAPTVQGSALEGMKSMPPAALIETGEEKKRIATSPSALRNDTKKGSIPNVPVIIPKENPLAGVRKQTLDVMDITAAATGHLSGLQAVCTGCAIQALWFWRNAEDLRQAKRNIDYLLQLLEGEQDGTN